MQRERKKIVTVCVISGLIALHFGVVGCSKMQSAEAFLTEAKEYRQKGDNKAAIIQLKNALQKEPDDAQARYLLGTIYNETGDPLSAEKELRKALSLGMSPATVAPGLGKSLYMLGQFQKVLDETSQAAAEKPDAELLVVRGNAYLALGKPAEAKQLFDRALTEKAQFADALIGLAKHALSLNDIDTAMRIAEQAVTTHPTNATTWYFKADLLGALGQVDPALAAYDEVLKLKAGDARAHTSKASLEITAKKFAAAKENLEAARKTAPGDLNLRYTQALLDYNQGEPAKAWESLEQILRVAPEHPPSVLLAGAVQHALGSSQQAQQYLRKALAKYPGNLYASRLMVSSLLKNGDTERAISVLVPALQYTPQDPQLLSLAGETYMRAKEYRKATEYFEKASALAPQASIIRTALGMSRLAQGESARAIADLEISADLDPKSSQAGVLLVMTHLRNKEFDKALAAASKLEKAQPDNPLYPNLKGATYTAKKDLAAARTSYQKALALQPSYYPAVANLARLDMAENKPDAAKKRIESFLEIDKKNVMAMAALAGIASSQGRNEEATAWLERASNEKPDEVGPTFQLAAHYLRIGEKRKALTLTQKLSASNASNVDVLDLLAQAQLTNNDKAAALQSYSKLATLMPNSELAQFRIAFVHMQMQDESAAVAALKKALSLKPDYVDAQLALAGVDVRKGNYEQALAIARQIQKQAAKLPIGYELEGDVLMAQKKPALASKAYENAIARNKSGLVLIKIHQSLSQSGNEKDGIARLTQWIKEHPSDTHVRIHLGTIQLLKQQNKGAIEQFQAVLRTEPNNVAALNNLALAYQHEKDPRAIEYAEKAYKLAPENPGILDTLGWLLVEQGNTARGLPILQKAATLVPQAADIQYHLVLGLVKSGDKAKARKELEHLLASGKQFSKIDEAKELIKQLQKENS